LACACAGVTVGVGGELGDGDADPAGAAGAAGAAAVDLGCAWTAEVDFGFAAGAAAHVPSVT
jgi:hypothetical protein